MRYIFVTRCLVFSRRRWVGPVGRWHRVYASALSAVRDTRRFEDRHGHGEAEALFDISGHRFRGNFSASWASNQ